MLTSKTFLRPGFLGLACTAGSVGAAQATQVAGGVTISQAPVPAAILQPTTPLPAATIDPTTGYAAAPARDDRPDARVRRCPGRCSAGRPEGDLGGEQADRQAVPLRRRAPSLQR